MPAPSQLGTAAARSRSPGGVEVGVLGGQRRRDGQQPRLGRVPGEPDGLIDDPRRGRIWAGLGQRLGQAEQQLGPAGRGGLRRLALHVQGVPEMAGGFLPGQRGQRLLAGQPAVVHSPGGGFGAGRSGRGPRSGSGRSARCLRYRGSARSCRHGCASSGAWSSMPAGSIRSPRARTAMSSPPNAAAISCEVAAHPAKRSRVP